MRTHRLYVPGPLRAGAGLELDPERSHYLSRVLRARPGDALVLFDGRGGEHPATVADVAKQAVTVTVGAVREGLPEPPLDIHLLQGISRGERMDWVVQKATELGVARLTPVLTEFSVVQLGGERAARRGAHWTKIAQAACEQCGRNRVPVIAAPRPLADVLAEVPARDPAGTRILLDPAAPRPLASGGPRDGRVELLIGPEGGLSAGEHARAEAAGFAPRSLGPRVLRTETAAIAALAVLQARWGDFA
ncbi:MAG TPA: 16S rRNA (uracil(1498)-N(3))-methyltransferase [Woeseiaceae bacterium]